MQCLARATEPGWAERALARADALLVDHAHCEKKAAGTALSLIFRYPQHAFLHEPLSRLAREELVHFEQVLALLARRGIPFRAQRPGRYAGLLRAPLRSAEPARLVDLLLCAALIEARSCERFALLAEAADDAELRRFYASLRAAEARHHEVYVGLAAHLAPADAVAERLATLAAHEARVLAEAPAPGRMHG